jgi:branched-chain amino acid transport system substrate-binding protein
VSTNQGNPIPVAMLPAKKLWEGKVMSFPHLELAALSMLALICGFGTGAVQPAAAEPTIIRIGAVVDQTGGSTSPLYRAAVELAASQMNAALDRSGSQVKFEVIFGDSKSNPPFAQSEALRLINQEQVKALVTDSSGVTVTINRLNYDPATPPKQKVPITCFQCSSSFINDPNVTESDPLTQAAERDVDNWLFRVFYVAKYEAAVLVQIALDKTSGGRGNGDGNFKIGILADGGHRALATGIAAVLPSFYQDPSSTEIIYMSALDKLGADWAKVVDNSNEMTGKNDGVPDVVIVAMLPEAASEAIKTYRQGGHAIPILSNNSFRRNYILKQVGAAANGLEGSSVTLADKSASGDAFLTAFQAATGQAPEMTSSGAYDSTITLMLAALVAAGDATQPHDVAAGDIRDGLTKINNNGGQKVRPTVEDFGTAIRVIAEGKPINYEGAYDSGDWDAVGDMFPPLVHWKVENQQFVEYELYRCSPQRPLCPVK